MTTQPSPNSAQFVRNSRVRLGLLMNLLTGPKSPSQLASIEKRHVSHVSRALAEMKARGIVESMPRASRETFYRLTAEGYIVYSILSRVR